MSSCRNGDSGYHQWAEEYDDGESAEIAVRWMKFLLEARKLRVGEMLAFKRKDLFLMLLSAIQDTRYELVESNTDSSQPL